MTKDEVLMKYGDVPLKFDRYYKYTFSFSGIASDGAVISLWYGGDHNDIYRFSVDKDTVMTLKEEYKEATVYKDGAGLWSDYVY